MPQLYPFDGVIQHYAWGGYTYLPKFLNRPNEDQEPWAELWMGAHAKGPGRIKSSHQTLDEIIAEQPAQVLGPKVAARFDDRLPFLFKVLDVREMLSIQVHPTKRAAEEGFAREEKNGPDREAPDRNYRDDNHKPELGVALTDFYLLHGFRSRTEIARSLQEVPGWEELTPILQEKGVSGLYAYVMDAQPEVIDQLLTPLAKSLEKEESTRDEPRFWAKRAVEQYTRNGHHDRGMFSIFWFNLVKLQPGQGIFQDAGIPHAYLEGVCIELMANSDNVLRGGLTPKHIDVAELLDKTRFEAVTPSLLSASPTDSGWSQYATPAPDFKLQVAELKASDTLILNTSTGPAILLLLKGELRGKVNLDEQDRTVFIPAGQQFDLSATAESLIYMATVGG